MKQRFHERTVDGGWWEMDGKQPAHPAAPDNAQYESRYRCLSHFCWQAADAGARAYQRGLENRFRSTPPAPRNILSFGY